MIQITVVDKMKDFKRYDGGAPGETRTPDPLLRRL